MSNPSGSDRDDTPTPPVADRDAETAEVQADDAVPADQHTADHDERVPEDHDDRVPDPDEQVTNNVTDAPADSEAATEVFATEVKPKPDVPERRFTAPGFDAGQTEVIQQVPEAATEVFERAKAAPQLIPPRLARKLPASATRSWGWVLALIVIILALAVIAVLGTLWLTRGSRPKVSQEDRVRSTIENFDIAVQNGDLATLRTITCGSARDGYVNYNEQAWSDTYRRVAAAKRYPVVASIDEVVVNGDHAEANVTAFMAYAPQMRSTRSFDLQYRDDQWKICQTHTD